jgi:geranylgeranyl pyrophosphate synthase
VRTLSRFALFCGVAFQIQDDLRSFGSTAINGKSPAEDLLEGKITLPLIRFFEVADQGARTRAREFFTCPRPERRASEAAWLSRSIVEAGCLHHAREIGYVAAARATHEWDALAPELLPGAGAEFLAALPRMMVTHS